VIAVPVPGATVLSGFVDESPITASLPTSSLDP
jgi:hypothetical protein